MTVQLTFAVIETAALDAEDASETELDDNDRLLVAPNTVAGTEVAAMPLAPFTTICPHCVRVVPKSVTMSRKAQHPPLPDHDHAM